MFVNWANSGKSPAFHAKANFEATVLPLSGKPTVPPPPCDRCGEGDIMLPNVPIGRTPHVDGVMLTQSILNDIIAGRALIWLTGRIDYVDGASVAHKTFVCYNFEADGSFINCSVPGSNYAD